MSDVVKGTVAEIPDELGEATAPRLFDLDSGTHVLSLAERFVMTPFSVLDGRTAAWQDRKRLWLNVIASGSHAAHAEIPDVALNSSAGRTARAISRHGREEGDDVTQKLLSISGGVSIFDPVLCELAYRWFCPQGGLVLDPFAGGNVRGIVAAVTGRTYVGIDLSPTQVQANREMDEALLAHSVYDPSLRPRWYIGDSSEALTVGCDRDGAALADSAGKVVDDGVDMVWSCPPYFDLERYSDDPRDLSNMDWDEFRQTYCEVIADACSYLRPNRFAGFVVGEIRDHRTGFYRNLVGLTVQAFEDAGLRFYNEATLVSPAGTMQLRTARSFVRSRKLGRTHQTLLIFCNGDPMAATDACQDMAAMEGAVKGFGQTLTGVLDVPDEDLTRMGH